MGECFFWYRPTWVVPDQRPLNGCACSSKVNDSSNAICCGRNCTANQLPQYRVCDLSTSCPATSQLFLFLNPSLLDLLTVGPKFTLPACRAAAAAVDQYLLLRAPELSSKPAVAAISR